MSADLEFKGKGRVLRVIEGEGVVPPHSVEAEACLIDAVLADETGKARAIAESMGIRGAAFYVAAHRVVWEAIEVEWREHGVCDLSALAVRLETTKQLDEVGGYGFLSALTSRVRGTSAAHVRPMASTVKLLWEQRAAIAYALGFVEQIRAIAPGDSIREEFVKLAGELGQKLIRLGRVEASRTLAETFDDVAAEARARATGQVDKAKWVYTGLAKFDELAKPMGSRRADGFVVLAAGSGDGKTTFMCQMGVANLELGRRVLVISREIDTAGFIEKGVSARLSIDLNGLESLPAADLARFEAECLRQKEEWAGKRLWCIQQEAATPIFTVEDVCDRVRSHVNLYGAPELILIDYLQIFDARKRVGGQNREAVVAFVSHTLQALQREIGCVMVVGCQLNEKGLSEMRESRTGDDGKPKFRMPNRGDLRESQAAYHDADRVLFLFRPPVDALGQDQHAPGLTTLDVWLYQEKRRAGATGYAVTRFEKRFCRFTEAGHRAPLQAPVAPPPGKPDKSRFMKP